MASLTSLVTGSPIPIPVSTKPRPSLSLRSPPISIECSSRPRKKATSHHAKTRPKKTAPWDIKRRGPTKYPPLPPLPPDWTLVESGGDAATTAVAVAEQSEAE